MLVRSRKEGSKPMLLVPRQLRRVGMTGDDHPRFRSGPGRRGRFLDDRLVVRRERRLIIGEEHHEIPGWLRCLR